MSNEDDWKPRRVYEADWKPRNYAKDPTTNALLNIAASLSEVAVAVDGLLYGLKYSKRDGLSIAEAIDEGAKRTAESLDEMGHRIAEVAEAIRQEPEPPP